MTWSTSEIVKQVIAALDRQTHLESLDIPLYDEIRGVGIGLLGKHELVLMLPEQSDSQNFETEYAKYSVSVQLYQDAAGQQVVNRSLLICKFDERDIAQIQAIAAIFEGLVSLEKETDRTAQAIWALKNLFENGFKNEVSIEKVKGLFGELLVLCKFDLSDKSINAWHSDPNSKFDYSTGNLRIEVKTTSGAQRVHDFSQGQVPGPAGVDTLIASVLLQVVENGGLSLSEFLLQLSHKLAIDKFERVLSISSDYLGSNPLSVRAPSVDILGSIANIEFFNADEVPYPVAPPETSDLHWKSNLAGLEPAPIPDLP